MGRRQVAHRYTDPSIEEERNGDSNQRRYKVNGATRGEVLSLSLVGGLHRRRKRRVNAYPNSDRLDSNLGRGADSTLNPPIREGARARSNPKRGPSGSSA